MPAVRRAVAATLVLVLAGGCSLAGRTLGMYVDDKRVRGAVKRQLADEAGRQSSVRVDTFEGTVYLSGVVKSALEKSQAEIAAWQVDGVRQVVNDLVVRAIGDAPSASPSPLAASLDLTRYRLPGVARLEPGRPGGPDLAYDRQGRVIATVYTLSGRELAQRGLRTLRAGGRPIDHVTVVPVVDRAEVPAPQYAVVLWHVSEPAAAGVQ